MSTTYTAVGFWDDSDTLQLVGITAGVVEFFGGDGCSEGGPWAESFEVPDDEDVEIWICRKIDEIDS